ncbi:MAG: aldo/keto reductase [Rhodobacteraceae bacterium]|nr:aldo/keto reductase [Paracoccaceae bacterium]
MSVICLGTMTWGTQNSLAEGQAQMEQALAAGCNFLDTAEMYQVNPVRAETVGRTEEIIGDWNARTGRRDEWIIASKIGGAGGAARGGEPITGESFARALDGSLARLKTDRIDLYQLHWPNRDTYHFRDNWIFDPRSHDKALIRAEMESTLAAIGVALAEGKIRHWGLSNETCWGTGEWLRLADQMGLARPVSHQNEYSLLCRSWDMDLAEQAHNEGLALLAFSPLATGLLSGKYQGDVTPPGTRRTVNETLGGRVTPRVWAAVAAYLKIARVAGLDVTQMANAWVLTRPLQSLPIIGATTPGQLALALGAADLVLSPEVLAMIEAAHKDHPLPF